MSVGFILYLAAVALAGITLTAMTVWAHGRGFVEKANLLEGLRGAWNWWFVFAVLAVIGLVGGRG